MAISSTPTGSEIAAEWGKTLAGSKGSDYLGETGGLPTARPIKGSDFVGKSSFGINTSLSGLVQDSNPSGVCTVSISLNSNGATSGVGAIMNVPNWGSQLITGVGSEWEVMATLVSGSSPGGSGLGTYLALSTSRQWTITDTTDNGNPVVGTIKFTFRKVGTTSPTYVTGNVTLDATRGIGL